MPASRLRTVTSPAPVAAFGAMVTFAVICVALSTVVEFTVTPEAEKAAPAPAAKPVPVITMFWLVAP